MSGYDVQEAARRGEPPTEWNGLVVKERACFLCVRRDRPLAATPVSQVALMSGLDRTTSDKVQGVATV
jgi:hypothetical protein